MATADPVDAFVGWTLAGLGLVVGFVAWNNVDGGALALIGDVIRTGTIPHGITHKNPAGGTVGSNKAFAAAQFAVEQEGKPYRWGSTGPNSFDCSGLVYAAYLSVGIKLPRTTYGQIRAGHAVHPATEAIVIGDLVFPEPSHVMIALGDGSAVEAPHTGDVVKVIPLPAHPLAVRRVA